MARRTPSEGPYSQPPDCRQFEYYTGPMGQNCEQTTDDPKTALPPEQQPTRKV